MPEYSSSPAAQPAQILFHCSFCHREVPDLTDHKRKTHASGFPSKCEIVQCPKWKREHPNL